MRQAPPDDVVMKDEDKVFEDASHTYEVFFRSRDVPGPPFSAGRPFNSLHPHMSGPPHIKP